MNKKECSSGKVCHRSKFAAYQHMGKLLDKESGTSVALLMVYRCKECGCWHVGHMPRPLRTKLGLLKIPLTRRDEWLNDLAVVLFEMLTDMRHKLCKLHPEIPVDVLASERFVEMMLDVECEREPRLARIRTSVERELRSRVATLEKKAS
jgi:hypothetical protein